MTFKKSIQIGLVSVATVRGRVEKVLPGDLYTVSYSVNDHEYSCTVSAVEMVPARVVTHQPATPPT